MLNYLWGLMLILAIVFGAFNGKMDAVTNALLDSSKEAVSLCITMLGIMGVWVGIMEIAKESGLIDIISKKLQPLVTFLFPKIPKKHKANEYVLVNIIANILGLGWAATPAGLKAMEALEELEKERETPEYTDASKISKRSASYEMCTFLVINISSLQLIPLNMIAYRSQYGSVNPTIIGGPAIIATLISTMVAVIICKFIGMGGKLCRSRH